jgi:hypothetical protein
MHGYITKEQIDVQEKRMITLSGLPETMRNIKEDVRYIVSR